MKTVMKIIDKISGVISAIVGTVQIVVKVVKEALVDVTRVCAIVFFWTDVDEKVIEWMNAKVKLFDDGAEMLKNMLLDLFQDFRQDL